jgi:hypothetical protein
MTYSGSIRFAKTWPLLVFGLAALCSCSSLSQQVFFWSRSGQIQLAQERSAQVGLVVGDEAYEESLKRWPYISNAGLQRRALLYSLLTAEGLSLEPWLQLKEEENLNLELAQIAKARRRSAF